MFVSWKGGPLSDVALKGNHIPSIGCVYSLSLGVLQSRTSLNDARQLPSIVVVLAVPCDTMGLHGPMMPQELYMLGEQATHRQVG